MSNTLKRVAFHTLGCKVNFSETASISREFINEGYIVVDFSNQADVYVLNTCTVTDNADRKSRKFIRQIINRNTNPFIVVVGCYAQLKPKEVLKIPGVNLVVGINEKFNLPKYVSNQINGQSVLINKNKSNRFNISYSINERTRAYIKIQDGCSYNCSYCTIPLARGISRSGEIDEIVNVCNSISNKGIKEIVISGINVGDYRTKKKERLIDLIEVLDGIDGIERFRISSIEPNLLDEDIINFISKSNKFMPHFHIPLQSGSDKILRSMKRKYDTIYYQNLIEKIYNTLPNSSIGADVMVGFPGETEQCFIETLNYIKKIGLSYLHVFPYSERDKTPAKLYKEEVPVRVRNQRSKILQDLSLELKKNFYMKNKNNVMNILIDSFDGEYMYGFTANYIRVKVPAQQSMSNHIINTKMLNFQSGIMNGQRV